SLSYYTRPGDPTKDDLIIVSEIRGAETNELSRKTVNRTYKAEDNNYGNGPTTIIATLTSQDRTEVHTTEIEYENRFTDKWQLGLLSSQTERSHVTVMPPLPGRVGGEQLDENSETDRRTEFTYDDAGSLDTTIIQPNEFPTDEYLKIKYHRKSSGV